MSQREINYESAEGIAVITIDRPAKRNALSGAMCDALYAAWQRFAASEKDRVAVLTAAGNDVFTAGADLNDPPPPFWQDERVWAAAIVIIAVVAAALAGRKVQPPPAPEPPLGLAVLGWGGLAAFFSHPNPPPHQPHASDINEELSAKMAQRVNWTLTTTTFPDPIDDSPARAACTAAAEALDAIPPVVCPPNDRVNVPPVGDPVSRTSWSASAA